MTFSSHSIAMSSSFSKMIQDMYLLNPAE